MPVRLSALESVQIPWHFRCPISLELMSDPVTVSTGQTYDRSSIESWVATGNDTCPVTRSPLAEFTLIPNHTLRRLIQDWCVAHRSLGVERIPTPKQPADPSLVRHLLLAATSDFAAVADRAAALRRLRALARDSEKSRAVINSPDTRSALMAIAFDGPDRDLAAEAIGVLSMLPMSEAESGMVASRPDWLARLAGFLTGGSLESRASAAAVVEAAAARSAEARVAVGAAEGVVEGLVALVAEGERAGMRALFAICVARENRGRAVAAGAAAAAVGMAAEGERAIATVELLCRGEEGREAVVAAAGGGTAAVGMLARAMRGKAAEHAAGAMVAVVGGSEELQWEAVAAGVVPQLLVMVQGGCSDRGKRKAQVLLKLLRSAWAQYDSVLNSDDDYLQHF